MRIENAGDEIMGILGWMWDQIPILGIVGRPNRQEEKKLKELKKTY